MNKVKTIVATNRQHVRKVSFDLVAIITLGIPVLVLYLVGQPYERGFNCDDESIRYPYKENTISSAVLYVYSTTIPAITMIIVEYLVYVNGNTHYRGSGDTKKGLTAYLPLIWQVYLRIAPFAFGALMSQMTTDVAKYSVGRLRPHFIDVCQPMYQGQIFTLDDDLACEKFPHRYIIDFVCTNSRFDDGRKRDARLSFMSGHSSFAAYCLIYLVIYLQLRVKWSSIGFLRPLYQSLLIYLVLYTGFSRISDYKHHWSDVLIGLIQGTIVAILTTRYVSDLYVRKPSNCRDVESLKIDDSVVEINNKSSAKTPNYQSCRVEMDEMPTVITIIK